MHSIKLAYVMFQVHVTELVASYRIIKLACHSASLTVSRLSVANTFCAIFPFYTSSFSSIVYMYVYFCLFLSVYCSVVLCELNRHFIVNGSILRSMTNSLTSEVSIMLQMFSHEAVIRILK